MLQICTENDAVTGTRVKVVVIFNTLPFSVIGTEEEIVTKKQNTVFCTGFRIRAFWNRFQSASGIPARFHSTGTETSTGLH